MGKDYSEPKQISLQSYKSLPAHEALPALEEMIHNGHNILAPNPAQIYDSESQPLNDESPASVVSHDSQNLDTVPHINNEEESERKDVDDLDHTQRHSYAQGLRMIWSLVWSWAWEISAGLVGLVGIMAIVVTLGIHENKPLPEWPFSITINALVSLFVILLKAGIAIPVASCISQLKWQWYERPRSMADFEDFDSASRGAIGSWRLLYTLRGWHLASLGAVVTIISPAIDPFTQQLIHYPIMLQSVQDMAVSMPRTNNYTGYGARYDPVDFGAEPQIIGSFYNALFDPDTINSQIVPLCPTGNCTFNQPYRSLGVCSQCVDLTSQINTTYVPDSFNGGNDTLYYLPNGHFLNTTGDYWMNTTTFTPDALNFQPNTSLPQNEATITIFSAIMLQANTTYVEDFIGESLPLIGLECSLQYCTWTYEATVNESILYETGIPSYNDLLRQTTNSSNDTGSPDTIAESVLVPDPCLIDGQLHNLTYVSGPQYADRNGYIQLFWADDENIFDSSYYPIECVFRVDGVSAMSINQFVDPDLRGNAFGLDGAEPSSDVIDIIYDQGSATVGFINGTFQNISVSMTNGLRQWFGAGPVETNGIAFAAVTLVVVKWAWLTLPIALFLFSIVLLLATIFVSSRKLPKTVWKDSSLPLLFNGLQTSEYGAGDGIFDLEKMHRAADVVKIVLQKTDFGWRVVPDG